MTHCPMCGGRLEFTGLLNEDAARNQGVTLEEYRCTQCPYLTEVER